MTKICKEALREGGLSLYLEMDLAISELVLLNSFLIGTNPLRAQEAAIGRGKFVLILESFLKNRLGLWFVGAQVKVEWLRKYALQACDTMLFEKDSICLVMVEGICRLLALWTYAAI
jgi:hypothetical protein